MMGWDAMAVRAAASGLEFTTYPSVPPWPPDRRHEDGWDEVAAALFSAGTAADVTAEAESFDPDVMVIDCMLTAGHAAAYRLGVPVASLVHVRYAPFVHEWGSDVLKTDVVTMLDSAQCVLAAQPPDFDPPEAFRPGASAVGAVLRPGVPEQLDEATTARLVRPGDPWVLLSLSTTLQGQADVLPGLLQALGSLPVRVLLTLGGVLSPDAVPAPANVTVRGFLPHSAVLPHMAAVVTHAGMSTVTTALAFGVPMVCVPQGRDQPLNAGRVAELGAGLAVAAGSSSRELATAVRTVLGDPAYRTAARGLAAKTGAVGNGQLATDLVAAMARTASAARC
jgi:hypothetical protein